MPPRKKVKTKVNKTDTPSAVPTRKVIRGKRGRLQNLPNMPIDILLEIFQYLGPRDLLNLARTSKNLRKFLLNRRTCGLLWKTAMEDECDLPQRLSFISEMAWINLLFSPYCHSCSKGGIKIILWRFGVRYCPKCKSKFMKPFGCALRGYSVPEELMTVYDCPGWLNEHHGSIHIPELTGFLALWRETPETERKQLVQERTAEVEEIAMQANLCEDWMEEKAGERAEERAKIRQQRIKDIFRSLEEMGWGQDIKLLSYYELDIFKKRSEFQQAKPLTTRAWQGMRSELVAWLEERKAKRLENERLAVMTNRIRELSQCIKKACSVSSSMLRWQKHDPLLADIAMFPEVRAIVELPNEEVVTQTTFQPIVDALPSLMARWYEELKAQLGQELRKSYEEVLSKEIKTEDSVNIKMDLQSMTDMELFDLATSMFFCTRCREQVDNSCVTTHWCGRYTPDQIGRSNPSKDIYVRSVIAATKWSSWSRWCITSYTDAHKLAQLRRIAGLCGLDWKTVTFKEIDQREERFICTCQMCANSSIRRVMDGRCVRTHTPMKHDPSALELASPVLTTIAKAKERKSASTQDVPLGERWKWHWACTRCMPSVSFSYCGQETVGQHLANEHKLKLEDIQEEDVYLRSDKSSPTNVTEDELKEYRL